MTGIPQTQEEIRAAVEARAAEIEGTAETGTTPQPRRPLQVDLSQFSGTRYLREYPPAFDWLLDKSFRLNCLGAIVGPPGAGKGSLAIQLCVAVASGTSLVDAWHTAAPEPVVYLSAEDDALTIHRRVHHALEQLPEDLREQAAANFYGIPVHGGVNLCRAIGGTVESTANYEDLRNILDAIRPRLLVLDTLARFSGVDENDNPAMTAFCGLLEGLIDAYGCNIILLHHSNKTSGDLDMTFRSFVDLYTADMKTRLKENTWATKDHIIRTKLLPYFGKLKMCNITAQQIITWQNEMLNHKDENGKPYSPVYLKTVHNQLSAIFNHAVRYYNLRENPCKKAGSMGKKKNREMMFWTKEQYLKFAEVMMDKPLSFYAFEMLYWCGIREGELLALTPADFDFEKRTVSINKSYQRLNGQDLITTPKTEKSNRIITMPQFLAEEIQDYIKMLYGIGPNDRMFTVTKSYLHREMDRGAKEAGVPRIRIHDIRHSAVSLLIDMGFSATAIADRVGHESIDITYNYAHLFPSKQAEMADKLNMERSN